MNKQLKQIRINRPETVEIDLDEFHESPYFKKALDQGLSPGFAFGRLIKEKTGANRVKLVEYSDPIATIHLGYPE